MAQVKELDAQLQASKAISREQALQLVDAHGEIDGFKEQVG